MVRFLELQTTEEVYEDGVEETVTVTFLVQRK